MLKLADRFDEEAGIPDIAGASLSVEPPMALFTPPQPGSRYGQSRSVSLPSIIIIVLIHAVLIAALIQVRQNYVRHQEEKLTVVNLTPPPPPPPASETPPPPSKPEIVAPAPIVQTPVQQVQTVQTTTDLTPAPPSPPIAAPPAPPAVAVSVPSTVSGGDISAQMVAGKPPRYPTESRRKREQGTVLLSLVVGLDGRVSSISIGRSSGFARLDDAAMDAVRGWRWSPIIRDGRPVMVKGVVEIPFIIKT